MGIMHIIGKVGRFFAECASDDIKRVTGIDLMKGYDNVKKDYIVSKKAGNDLRDLIENKEEYEKKYGKEVYEHQLKEAELRRKIASENLTATFQVTPLEWEETLRTHNEEKMKKYLSKLSDAQLKNIDTRKLSVWAETLYYEERDKRGI